MSERDTPDDRAGEDRSQLGPKRVSERVGFDRRTFLNGLAATGALGAVGSGAATGASDEAGWEPASVPFGMETPWYDEVGPENARPEYPRPQMVRERWQSLNGVWEFAPATAGEAPPVGEQLGERILVPFPPEAPLSGIARHEPRMWYRREFEVPDAWRVPAAHSGDGVDRNPNARRLLLHFERVDWEATVYVNGEEVTTHRGGYDHFAADVTDHLIEEGPQELIVGVFDPTDTGTQQVGKQEIEDDEDIFFSPTSGIWATAWLEPVPATRIGSLDLTPDLEGEALAVAVDAANAADATVTATAYDGDEKVGRATGPPDEPLSVPVPDPHRWSPEDPFLYDLRVELRRDDSEGAAGGEAVDGGKLLDAVESYFGMRSVDTTSIRGVTRPTLNGEFVYHQGIYDQGYWPDGVYTAPTDEALRYDLERAEELGYNAYRKHIKVEPRRWFYHADRLGLLVWQDVPNQPLGQPAANEAAQEQWRQETRRQVEQNNDHPSLVGWIVVNEGWGHGKTNIDRIRADTRFVEDLDPERLVDGNSGENTMFGDFPTEEGDAVDYHVYMPGYHRGNLPTPTDDRFAFVGESSNGWVPIEGHQWGPREGGTPAGLVENLLRRAEKNERFMVDDGIEPGLSGTVNLQTTDTPFHYQGVVTYDREVFKPELADPDAPDRIRAANEALIAASREIEQGPYLAVESPVVYGRDTETFPVDVTFTNPEREASGEFGVEDVTLALADLPDGTSATARTDTAFDAVAEGESVTATWELEVDESSPPAAGRYVIAAVASFRADGETQEIRRFHRIGFQKPAPDLVGFWPFEEGSGTTTEDHAGDSDGTLVGDPTWTTGAVGSALTFDGVDDTHITDPFEVPVVDHPVVAVVSPVP
ncbi:MAG: sugar-binding domain-containing protein, partial [Halapricum sp.]